MQWSIEAMPPNSKTINKESPIPRYYQLSRILHDLIDSGVLREGDRLPSERKLLQDYGVSLNTVQRAVLELCNEGLVKREQGRGTFVTKKTKVQERTLRVCVVSPEWAAFMREFVSGFEVDFPGCEVELLTLGEPAYHALKDLGEGRLSADVIFVGEIEFRALAKKRLLLNLGPFLEKDGGGLLDDIPTADRLCHNRRHVCWEWRIGMIVWLVILFFVQIVIRSVNVFMIL